MASTQAPKALMNLRRAQAAQQVLEHSANTASNKPFGKVRDCSNAEGASRIRKFSLAVGDTSVPTGLRDKLMYTDAELAGMSAEQRAQADALAGGNAENLRDGYGRSVAVPKHKKQKSQHATKGALVFKSLSGEVEWTQGRRKRESNFFITLNLNKSPREHATADGVANALRIAVEKYTRNDTHICEYLVFGPVDFATYGGDKYKDVIESVDVYAGIERGPETGFVHAHVWLTFFHYSQIQINCKALAHLIKREYNVQLAGRVQHTYLKNYLIKPQAKLYCNVKLLPQSDFADIIRGYIIKTFNKPSAVLESNRIDSAVARSSVVA